MQDNLTVDVNPDGMHTLTVPERFGTEGAFDVVLKNHGEPTHVYLNLDDSLSEGATLNATNFYVEQDETLPITITISSNTSVSGDLTVATAYGGEKRFVPITVEPSEQDQHTTTTTSSSTSVKGTTRAASSNASTVSSSSSSSQAQSISRTRSGSRSRSRSHSRSRPQSGSGSTHLTATSPDEQIIRRTLPAFVFGVIAIILALSSLLVTGIPRVVLGVLAVLAGVFVIVYFAVT